MKLVTSFGELRPGVIVWLVVKCAGCGRDRCRSMVLGDDGRPCQCGKRAVAITSCDGLESCLCPDNVAAREVYRVIDEQLDADTTGERTTRELERTR